jgi:hypothetical protein
VLAGLRAWWRRRAQERFDRGQHERTPAEEIELTPADVDREFLSSFREHGPALSLVLLASGWDLDETREWAASAEERGLVARSGDSRWRITDERGASRRSAA